MNQSITVSQKTLEAIFDRLEKVTREVKSIRKKLEETEPLYGSEAWWRWAEKKADEDIDKRKVVKFNSVREAVKWLNS